MTRLDYVLWFAAPACQLAILVAIIARRLQRDLPLFLSYTILQVINFFALLLVYHLGSPAAYFRVYWTLDALSVGAGLAVIYEIFSQAFKPYAALRDFATLLYKWAAIVMVFVTGIFAVAHPGADADRIVAWILSLERVVRLLQCGLLLFFFLFAGRLGLRLRSYIVGIAFGFGSFAATELALVSMRFQMGSRIDEDIFSTVTAISYNLSVFIWLAYLSAKEPLRRDANMKPQPDRWDYALYVMANPSTAGGGMLELMEQTVDRVMKETGR
jgi:hypothetical protein